MNYGKLTAGTTKTAIDTAKPSEKGEIITYLSRMGDVLDDGISGTSFDRSDFNRMQRMVEEGKIGTIIVKDLSRFGREHIEGGRLAEIVYPTLGVTFISIHENVNTSTGEGMEMMPFYNIFNEKHRIGISVLFSVVRNNLLLERDLSRVFSPNNHIHPRGNNT